MRWPLRRRTPRPPAAPATGNGREQAAAAALRRTERKAEKTEELIVRGELLAKDVRRALGMFR